MRQVLTETRSIKGRGGVNDDRLSIFQTTRHGQFALIADGLGGHSGGYRAAQIVVDQFEVAVTEFETDYSPIDLFDFEQFGQNANRAIWEQQQADPSRLGDCRTTALALHIDSEEQQARWAHCGDSRLYHIRDRSLVNFTKDHSIAQMLVYDGEISRNEILEHPDKNKLTRCFGGSPNEAQFRIIPEPVSLLTNDLFLLCSDGWWEFFTDEEIVELSTTLSNNQESISVWLDTMENRIIEKQTTEPDDRSVCVIRIK